MAQIYEQMTLPSNLTHTFHTYREMNTSNKNQRGYLRESMGKWGGLLLKFDYLTYEINSKQLNLLEIEGE